MRLASVIASKIRRAFQPNLTVKNPRTWDRQTRACSVPSDQTTTTRRGVMPTLRIEHRITDFETWSAAFNRFADARLQAGVRAHRVQRPIDDPNYVLVDLEFGTTEAAEAFLSFLTTTVWATPENSPALAGTPQTRILTNAAPDKAPSRY
jgi:hypothetical protein